VTGESDFETVMPERLNLLMWFASVGYVVFVITANQHQWMVKVAVIRKHNHSLHLQYQCCAVLDVVFMLIPHLMACAPNVSKQKIYLGHQSVV
jgi:hypothetical protein